MNLKNDSNFSHDVPRTIETAPDYKNNGQNSIGKKSGSNEGSKEFSPEMISFLKSSPENSPQKRKIINSEGRMPRKSQNYYEENNMDYVVLNGHRERKRDEILTYSIAKQDKYYCCKRKSCKFFCI